mmetsp:Transcript_4034/g.8662  ORF Transcript_4034/g.8662 Transcript_4034/m.8662 type:complete len:217 (+) Transcript_4034:318-968(+)
MCLIPGMLAPGPSRPSERAKKFAVALSVMAGIMFVLSLGLVVSFSVWSVLQNLIFVLYAYMVVRPFRNELALVFIENILCFSLLTGLTGMMSIFTLVNLITKQQLWAKKLENWQIYTGITLASIITVTYVAMSILSYILFRDLQNTTVQMDEESAAFLPGMRGGSPSGYRSGGGTFGSFGYPPTGSYIRSPITSQAAQPQAPQRDRFPGKGYKLNG